MAIPGAILVPIVQSQASLDAVPIAAAIARLKKGRVYVVHVIEVGRSLPMNAELEGEARRGEQLIRRAEEVAAEAGYPVTGVLLQAREAGPAILEEATDNAVDAIILGMPSAAKTGPARLGSTAEYIVKNATCCVWVVRQSMVPQVEHHQI